MTEATPPAKEFSALLERFTRAVEAGDGTALAALFTPQGVYHDTFYGEFTGREAIREMLEQHFWRDAQAFKWTMQAPVCDGRTGYASWDFSYTSSQPHSAGTRVVARGMSRFELQGELIVRYEEMFEGARALVQLDMPPEKLARWLRKGAEALRADPALKSHLEP